MSRRVAIDADRRADDSRYLGRRRRRTNDPTMTFLSQVLAISVAIALLAYRVRGRGPLSSGRSIAVMVVVVALTFVSLSSFWGVWEGFRKDRRTNASITPADAATRGGVAAGANAQFVEWVNANMPKGATYQVSGNANDIATYQWLTFRLYPRVATDGEAGWIVFLNTTPEAEGYKAQRFSRVLKYSPSLQLAELKR
jgi:hypothetical protein